VLFDKKAWTKTAAKKWLKEHNFYSDGLDEKNNLLRYRPKIRGAHGIDTATGLVVERSELP
jgi:hypothetical protein